MFLLLFLQLLHQTHHPALAEVVHPLNVFWTQPCVLVISQLTQRTIELLSQLLRDYLSSAQRFLLYSFQCPLTIFLYLNQSHFFLSSLSATASNVTITDKIPTPIPTTTPTKNIMLSSPPLLSVLFSASPDLPTEHTLSRRSRVPRCKISGCWCLPRSPSSYARWLAPYQTPPPQS